MYYYHCEDSISSNFFMVPKSLFTDKYADISANAKIMYIHMLDRCKLSIKNRWIDDANHIFIVYPIEQLATLMHLKKSRIYLLLKELESQKLIMRKRSGGMNPNQIYIANIEKDTESTYYKTEETQFTEELHKRLDSLLGVEKEECGDQKYGDQEEAQNDIHKTGCHNVRDDKDNDIHNYGGQNDIRNYGGKLTENTACSNHDIHNNGKEEGFKTDKCEDDVHKSGGQTVGNVHNNGNMMSTKVAPSNNNINNNNIDIDAGARARSGRASSEQKEIETVRQQIGYNALVSRHPGNYDAINGIVSMMMNVYKRVRITPDESVLAGEHSIPLKKLAAKYELLTFHDIDHILRAAKGKKISNYWNYFTVCLYQAEISTYKTMAKAPREKKRSFCNFEGRDLTKTIEVLEMLQATPRRVGAMTC